MFSFKGSTKRHNRRKPLYSFEIRLERGLKEQKQQIVEIALLSKRQFVSNLVYLENCMDEIVQICETR